MNPRLSPLSTDETLFFEVPSQSNPRVVYDTWYDIDHHWICTCPDYYYRKRFCKHMGVCAELLGIDDIRVYEEMRA